MPAQSEAQQRLMGMALAAKRGKGHYSGKVKELADSMTEKQLHDFAATKHEGLPEKKGYVLPSSLIPFPVNPGPDPASIPMDIGTSSSADSGSGLSPAARALLRAAVIATPIAAYYSQKNKKPKRSEKHAQIIDAIKFKIASDANLINANIASSNANPHPTIGSPVADFQHAAPNYNRRPAYTPTPSNAGFSKASVIESLPVLGHVLGPPARLAENDALGAGLGVAIDGLAVTPGGQIPAGTLMGISKARDYIRYVNEKSKANNAFEKANSIPQG